jgi:non-canonical poly(A) RNA polymerase PAPD5/7
MKQGAMQALPPLRPLCLVLKIFLQQRELNEVYQGGIGSYALLVMLLAHLQMHPSKRRLSSSGQTSPLESNLGILLVDFFDLYGRSLNMKDVGVSCRIGGSFFSKKNRGFIDMKRPFSLCVEDPQAPDNDIGKNSFAIQKVVP